MADPYVREYVGFFTGTVGSTDIGAGDLIYFDGTDWELADASDNTIFAEAMSLGNYQSGVVGGFCLGGVVVDTDAPYTQGDQYYLSETAGAITATRPTTAASLRQLCGFDLSTSELRVKIEMVREYHQSYNFRSNAAQAQGTEFDPAGGGDFLSAMTNADDEDFGATFACPQNEVGIEIAYLYTGAEVVTGATDFDMLMAGANDGEQHDAGTQDTLSNLVASGASADEIQRNDVTTGLDAAGNIEPDNVVGVHLVHDGAQTDEVHAFALHIVWLVV